MFSWDSITHWFGEHFWAVVIILLAAWLARHFGSMVIAQIIRRIIHHTRLNALSVDDVKKRQDTLISMCTALWKVALFIIVALVLFCELFPEIDLTPVFASAGIIGIALGFGAQSLIKDFLSGIFIIAENQYRVGDVVDLEGAAGTVEQITIRSTILRDADGNVHYIPNGSILHVINKTMGFSRVNFAIAVAPDTNIDKLSEIINEVGNKLAADEKWEKKIIDPPHFLSIGSFTDVALEVKISGKTQPSKQWDVSGEYRKRLLSAFKKHHIESAQLPGSALPAARKR